MFYTFKMKLSKIPILNIEIPQNGIEIILLALIIYFGVYFTSSFFKQDDKNYWDFYFTEFIGIIAICFHLNYFINLYNIAINVWTYLKYIQLPTPNISVSKSLVFIGLVILSIFISLSFSMLKTVIFTLRSKEKSKKLGVSIVAPANKAVLKGEIIIFSIIFIIIFVLIAVHNYFPKPIDRYYLIIIFFFPIIFNLELLLLLIPSKKLKERITKKYKIFEPCIDRHEMHYQHIGIEPPSNEEYYIPEIIDILKTKKMIDELTFLSLNRGLSSNFIKEDSNRKLLIIKSIEWNKYSILKNIINNIFLGINSKSEIQDFSTLDKDYTLKLKVFLNEDDNYHKINYLLSINNNDYIIIKKLLENGMDPNLQSARGRTALMYAAGEGRIDIIKLLIEYGADVNIKNYLSKTALDYASNFGFLEILKFLLENGAKMNPNYFKDSEIMLAVRENHYDIVNLLIENGAIININDFKKSELRVAIENGNYNIFELLLKSVDNIDYIGQELLSIAENRGHGNIAKILRKRVKKTYSDNPDDWIKHLE